MRHTLISRNAAALVMTIAILASALASMGRPLPVAADLGDGHTRSYPRDDFRQLMPEDRREHQLENGRITRNLVKGESLTVCSTDFWEATKTAVDRWNTALSREVLTLLEKDSMKCQNARAGNGWLPKNGVKAVFVSVGEQTTHPRTGKSVVRGDVLVDRYCPATSYACVRQDHVEEHPSDWRTRYGRLEVIVNPTKFCHDTGMPGGNSQCTNTRDDDDLRHLITHELGHALSLGDYRCNYYEYGMTNPHPDFISEKTIMDTRWLPACDPENGRPTDHDKNDYVKIYTPSVVTVDGHGADGRPVDEPKVDGQTVTLYWNQSTVFVESDFEIQRKNGAIWEMEEIADANAESITLTNQPGGEQLYRIRARTLALCPAGEDCRQVRKHFYGDPSAEITVSVPLPTPTDLTVTARTLFSLTLNWTAGVGASFHEVKATTHTNCEESETYDTPDPDTATSHPFPDLMSSTIYRLCVRSVRTVGDVSVKSAWVGISAATGVKLAAPSTRFISSSDIATNIVTLRWSKVADADGYEVKRTEGSGETTIESLPETARSREFKGLLPNKPYTFYVRATLSTDSAVTSAWASRSATTSTAPPPTPPTAPTPSALSLNASVNPMRCYPEAEVSVEWRISGGSGSARVMVGDETVTTSPTSVACQKTATNRQEIIVRAWDGNNSARFVLATTVLSPPPPSTCLSSTALGYATYGTNCGAVKASDLFPVVVAANSDACALWHWRDGAWLGYSVSDDGQLIIPGSVDYTINPGGLLSLMSGDCDVVSGSGGAGGASSGEPPSCPDALKPSSGPTVIDADSTDCATVRGGGAVQISRDDYTLNLTLPSDRDWWALAPTSYHGNPSGAFLFVDLSSGGWLALNPATAAELARHIPADADGLPAHLNAIAASASVPAVKQ